MNEIDDYFDMCYVITAPHLTERHKYIENLFKSYKIDKYKFIYVFPVSMRSPLRKGLI